MFLKPFQLVMGRKEVVSNISHPKDKELSFLEGGSTSIAMRSMLVDWLIQVHTTYRRCSND